MIRSFGGKTPRIAASAFISEAAYIIGDVEIGENSSVWPGAVIRGDMGKITIGANTSIEDGGIIHSGSRSPIVSDVVIGDMVQFGHGAVSNCRRIGNNVLIGMNATLLHDVEIGSHCVIAAGCVVQERMKVPDNSLVAGVPGKIKGNVPPEHLWWVEQAPLIYVDLARQHKEQGF